MTAPTETPASSWPGTARQVKVRERLVGGVALPVFAGPRRGADVVHVSLRRHHGEVSAERELATVRDATAEPLLVEPFSADDLEAVRQYADGVVVGGSWMQDFRLLSAVGGVGLPTVVHRGYHTVDEWLSAVEYVRAAGSDEVVLCEAGARRFGGTRRTLDLAVVREASERAGLPVVVDVGDTPWLAGAAIAAGADGVWLGEDASRQDVDRALETALTLTPTVRRVRPDTLRGCREAIDRVDSALAALLEYRVGLAGQVQRYKSSPGHCGRDVEREAEIVRSMSRFVPSLTHDQLATIMDAIIVAGLDAAERSSQPPVWRL